MSDDEKGASEAGTSEVPKCPSCGRPTDDIAGMGEAELLAAIHLGLLQDLARSVRNGTANHQELAIARGILRDNKKVVPAEPDEDDALPPPAPKRKLPKFHNED